MFFVACMFILGLRCFLSVHISSHSRLCPFISSLCVLALSFVRSLWITCSICSLIPGNSLFFMLHVALCKLHNTARMALLDWLRRFHFLPLLELVSKIKPSVPHTQTSDSNLSSRNVKQSVIFKNFIYGLL